MHDAYGFVGNPEFRHAVDALAQDGVADPSDGIDVIVVHSTTTKHGGVHDDRLKLRQRSSPRPRRGDGSGERLLLADPSGAISPLLVLPPHLVSIDATYTAHAGLVLAALFEGDELNGRAFNLSSPPLLTASECVAELAASTGRDLHFHPRSLGLSQAMEVGKWIVKRVGGRAVDFPSQRDLSARGLFGELSCETAREVLDWRPIQDRDALLARCLHIYGER